MKDKKEKYIKNSKANINGSFILLEREKLYAHNNPRNKDSEAIIILKLKLFNAAIKNAIKKTKEQSTNFFDEKNPLKNNKIEINIPHAKNLIKRDILIPSEAASVGNKKYKYVIKIKNTNENSGLFLFFFKKTEVTLKNLWIKF